MLLGISVWIIIAPILAAQYILAVVGLILLGRRQMPKWQYILWNLCILLVFFVGTIAFLIYNAVHKDNAE